MPPKQCKRCGTSYPEPVTALCGYCRATLGYPPIILDIPDPAKDYHPPPYQKPVYALMIDGEGR